MKKTKSIDKLKKAFENNRILDAKGMRSITGSQGHMTEDRCPTENACTDGDTGNCDSDREDGWDGSRPNCE